jgi:hypothetical protein
VFVLATFPAVPTGAGITFMITKNDANGEYVQNMDYAASPQHTTAYIPFTINTPGKYFVRMVNYYDKSQVWATTDFIVGEYTVGARDSGNTAAGQGKVSICKKIDDNWNCVGESYDLLIDEAFVRKHSGEGSLHYEKFSVKLLGRSLRDPKAKPPLEGRSGFVSENARLAQLVSLHEQPLPQFGKALGCQTSWLM